MKPSHIVQGLYFGIWIPGCLYILGIATPSPNGWLYCLGALVAGAIVTDYFRGKERRQ